MPSGFARSTSSAGDLGEVPINGLRQRLNDEVVPVAIDDQRRNQIRLAVHEATRCGVDRQPLRGSECVGQPRLPETVAGGSSPDATMRMAISDRSLKKA